MFSNFFSISQSTLVRYFAKFRMVGGDLPCGQPQRSMRFSRNAFELATLLPGKCIFFFLPRATVVAPHM